MIELNKVEGLPPSEPDRGFPARLDRRTGHDRALRMQPPRVQGAFGELRIARRFPQAPLTRLLFLSGGCFSRTVTGRKRDMQVKPAG